MVKNDCEVFLIINLINLLQESESEDENLDDLEKHLREKALRSMRKAQASPPSWGRELK